jgi:Domain of unknown function (DUF4131)
VNTSRAVAQARPHLLLGGASLGLGVANFVRPRPLDAATVALVFLVGAVGFDGPARILFLAAVLAVSGLLVGGVRLAALDHTVLAARVGEAGPALLEVTGPVRRGEFDLRIPARTLRFDGQAVSEPVLLELPLGRSPPQGARLALNVEVRAPRGPEDGFDEKAWLRRQGVHVVLRGREYRVAGRRGGLGGVADGLRRWLARGAAPGLEGERRAVILGVVLGADEGLSKDLRDRFRSSGLYHLLRELKLS